MGVHARRRGAAAGVFAAAVVVVAVLAAALGGGGDSAPSDDAARLVPAGALAYVHLSTDTGRAGVRRALALAKRFPGWPGVRAGLLRRLTAPRCGVSARDLRGREAALALFAGERDATAGSLVLIDTGRDAGGRARSCGSLVVRRLGRFLAIGQPDAIATATALGRGKGRSLALTPLYRRAVSGLPAGRVLDGYVSAAGLRRLVAPRGGLLGAAGVLLDRPGLQAIGFGVEAQAEGARLVANALTDRRAVAPRPRPFRPALAGQVPAGAMALVDIGGVGRAAGRLLRAAGSSTGLGGVLARVRRELTRSRGLERRLAALFGGETAVAISPALPAPILTVMAPAPDEAATRSTMAQLQAPLAAAFPPAGQGAGQAPIFDERSVAGQPAFQLRLAPGIELDYAVFDRKLVVSTRLQGIAAVRGAGRRLADTPAWTSVLDGAPPAVTSLTFLDFSELLRLGEQTGLNDSRAYRQVRNDLERVRAVGATSTGNADQTTVQVELSIP